MDLILIQNKISTCHLFVECVIFNDEMMEITTNFTKFLGRITTRVSSNQWEETKELIMAYMGIDYKYERLRAREKTIVQDILPTYLHKYKDFFNHKE